MKVRVKIAGVGGQGVQFIGKLLSDAAFRAGLNVSQGVKYEPSTSGGLTVADVTIVPDEEEIAYPFIESDPSILLVLAQRGWDEYKGMVGKNTLILADKSNVQNFDPQPPFRGSIHVPFAETAIELGSEKATNLVALGFLAELLDFKGHHILSALNELHPDDAEDSTLLEVAPEFFEESLHHLTPEKFRQINHNAFERGYQMSLDYEMEEQG